MKKAWIWIIIIIVVAIAGYFFLRGDQPEPTDTPGGVTSEALMVNSQVPGESVVVERATLARPGYVVVYRADAGTTTAPIGTSELLEAGEHMNIVITLDEDVAAGDNLDVVALVDDGDGELDAVLDVIALDDEGVEVMVTIDVVEANDVDTGPGGTDAGAEGTTLPPDPVTITYTDGGFAPKTVTVPVGTTVTWVNDSSINMWVASAMHPTHAVYDGTSREEHCQNGEPISDEVFDQCKGEAPETKWSFTFTKTGSWNYHDHLAANNFGTVVVE